MPDGTRCKHKFSNHTRKGWRTPDGAVPGKPRKYADVAGGRDKRNAGIKVNHASPGNEEIDEKTASKTRPFESKPSPDSSETIPSPGGSSCTEIPRPKHSVQTEPGEEMGNDDGTELDGRDSEMDANRVQTEPGEEMDDDDVTELDGREKNDWQLDAFVEATQWGGKWPPLGAGIKDATPRDLEKIEDLTRDYLDAIPPRPRMTIKQVAKKYGESESAISRQAKNIYWKKWHAIRPVPGLRGVYDPSPVAFPFPWAKEMKRRVHDIKATYLIKKRSMDRFHELENDHNLFRKLKQKKGRNGHNPPEKWLVPDGNGKIRDVWARAFDPRYTEEAKKLFNPLSTTKKIEVWMRGWGIDSEDALDNAWETADIIRMMYENFLGIKVIMSISDPAQAKYSSITRKERVPIQKGILDVTPDGKRGKGGARVRPKVFHGVTDEGAILTDRMDEELDYTMPAVIQQMNFITNKVGDFAKTSGMATADLKNVVETNHNEIFEVLATSSKAEVLQAQRIAEIHEDVSQLTSEVRSLVKVLREANPVY
jgi:hypothetical protein